jgi:nicotinate-nucleotide adenylyltransferase
MNEKIILFGGSFDPPHLGHLIIAQRVAEMLSGIVRFLPCGNPPHKQPLSSWAHRLAMLRVALEDNPYFCLDESEIAAETVNYTVDTLKRFQREYGIGRDELYFILGSDSLNALGSWRQPEAILQLCTLVVYPREPGFNIQEYPEEMIEQMIFCSAPIIGISSTLIRERVKKGQGIKYLVPEAVRKYICSTGLYLEGIG